MDPKDFLKDFPNIKISSKLSGGMYERIIKTIEEFEEEIGDDEQASVVISSFANNPILINDIGYWNPDIIILSNFDKILRNFGERRFERSSASTHKSTKSLSNSFKTSTP